MADLVTLPVSPLTADRIRSRSSWASSVVDGAPHDRSVSPRLGNYHPGRLLAPQGAEYPSFPSTQVHTRGGSPPERARDCHPCDLAPLHYRSPVPLPITDPADRLGPTSVAFPIVHSCTMFGVSHRVAKETPMSEHQQSRSLISFGRVRARYPGMQQCMARGPTLDRRDQE